MRFTVVWSDDAQDKLTALWMSGVASQADVTDAANRIDRMLRDDPEQCLVRWGSVYALHRIDTAW